MTGTESEQFEANVSAVEEAEKARKKQYQKYLDKLDKDYVSAEADYNTKKSTLPDSLTSLRNSLSNQIAYLEQIYSNHALFSMYAIFIFNGPLEHVKNVLTPILRVIRATFTQLPEIADYKSPNLPTYKNYLFAMKDNANKLIARINEVPHIIPQMRTAFIVSMTPAVQNVISKIDGSLLVVSQLLNLTPPSLPVKPTYIKWLELGLYRNFPIINSKIPPEEKAILDLPPAYRQFATNSVLPVITSSPTEIQVLQKNPKSKEAINRIFITTMYPNGENVPGRPEASKLAEWKAAGYKPRLVQSLKGDYYFDFIPDIKKEIDPKIILIYNCAISSFLGDYGAGATIQTFSLLPGEKTKITIKTYSREETKSQEASSIFDSASQTATTDFEAALQSQRGMTTGLSANQSAYANASAGANIGMDGVGANASVGAGVSGGSSQSLNTFANDVANTLQKYGAVKSSQRDVNVTKSRESTEEKGKEEGLERELFNPNLSRVLNFVFRQLNQEYLTLLHITDVKVAFGNGLDEDYLEVPLHNLDSLLERYINPGMMPLKNQTEGSNSGQSYRGYIKEQILDAFQHTHDYNGKFFNITEEVLDPNNPNMPTGIYRFVRKPYKDYCLDLVKKDPVDLKDKFPDIDKGLDHDVEGIIIGKERVIMRTDALIVESLLGQGMALDGFALQMQEQTAREKVLENEKVQLALDIISQKNLTPEQAKLAADLYYKIFGLTPMKQFAERTYPVIFPELKKTMQNLSLE